MLSSKYTMENAKTFQLARTKICRPKKAKRTFLKYYDLASLCMTVCQGLMLLNSSKTDHPINVNFAQRYNNRNVLCYARRHIKHFDAHLLFFPSNLRLMLGFWNFYLLTLAELPVSRASESNEGEERRRSVGDPELDAMDAKEVWRGGVMIAQQPRISVRDSVNVYRVTIKKLQQLNLLSVAYFTR